MPDFGTLVRLLQEAYTYLFGAQVPTLLVHGGRDDIVPAAMSREFAAAAGCELAELADDGHFEHIEPGSRAWATVVTWLERL